MRGAALGDAVVSSLWRAPTDSTSSSRPGSALHRTPYARKCSSHLTKRCPGQSRFVRRVVSLLLRASVCNEVSSDHLFRVSLSVSRGPCLPAPSSRAERARDRQARTEPPSSSLRVVELQGGFRRTPCFRSGHARARGLQIRCAACEPRRARSPASSSRGGLDETWRRAAPALVVRDQRGPRIIWKDTVASQRPRQELSAARPFSATRAAGRVQELLREPL